MGGLLRKIISNAQLGLILLLSLTAACQLRAQSQPAFGVPGR
jgi:hypothetical protein